MDAALTELSEGNCRWTAINARNPGSFTRLLTQHRPQCLCTDCADSGMPASEIPRLLAGDGFVRLTHRALPVQRPDEAAHLRDLCEPNVLE